MWIPSEQSLPVPAYVKEALKTLDEAGFVAYVVGGSVRDFLLALPTKDHDIATDAEPDDLEKLFPHAIKVGKAFGVLKVPVQVEGKTEILEIATFRRDLDYRDFRHPTGVVFAGPEEDARRRDFTINALFFDMKTQRILDSVDGIRDLKDRVIRAIGDSKKRFEEDALRLLRAVRFATGLGFLIEPDTAKALREKSNLIRKISAERIRDELTLMFTGPAPGVALERMAEYEILWHVLPEIDALRRIEQNMVSAGEYTVWKQTLELLTILSREERKRSKILAWGAVLANVGKPLAAKKNEGRNFIGHERDGAEIARKICERLKMSKHETDAIVFLVEEQMKFKEVFRMRESTLQRWVRQPYFPELLAIHQADAMSTDGNLSYYEFCRSRLDQYRKERSTQGAGKLLTGEDLISLGLEPGPKFAKILRTVEDLALEGKLRTQEEAFEFVVKHFVG